MKNLPGIWIATVFSVMTLNIRAAESPYIYGIHDADPDPLEYMNHIITGVGSGWVTATVAVGANPNDFSGVDFTHLANRGYTVICRLNYGYYPTGTIPLPGQYDNFATRCKNFVQATAGCSIWLIGNECNLPPEWPFDGSRFSYISPQSYASCYRKCYNAIRTVRPTDKILPQPSATFAGPLGAGHMDVNGTAYPHDPLPLNWVTYQNQVLASCKASGPVDGISLHIGSRGYTYSDIHSTQQINAGGQNLYWSFYSYRDWVNYGIPTNMWNLPIYATECNGYYYWSGGHPEAPEKHYEPGWMQEIHAEINRHNQTAYQQGKPIFRCINFYRWCGFCDGWFMDGSPYEGSIKADLNQAVAQKYTWLPNAARGISITAPATVTAGSAFSATVQMKNVGTKPWSSAGGTAHRLGSQSPQDNTTWGFNRVSLPSSPINPGATATFTINATAPASPGTHTFAWKMVQDGVEWFGDTLSRSIQVTSASVQVIVDNSNAGFAASANWATGTSATNKYGSNYRFRNTQAISDPATWNVTLPSSGSYQVSAWWPHGSNRSTNASYIVYHTSGSTTVKVNQQLNGGVWNSLGLFSLNGGANLARLSCWTTETNKVVMGDAMRWVRQ